MPAILLKIFRMVLGLTLSQPKKNKHNCIQVAPIKVEEEKKWGVEIGLVKLRHQKSAQSGYAQSVMWSKHL